MKTVSECHYDSLKPARDGREQVNMGNVGLQDPTMKYVLLIIGIIAIAIGVCGCKGIPGFSGKISTVHPTLLTKIGESLPGYQVTFASPRDAGNNQDIWVINSDGTGERNLTESLSGGDDIYPEWGPEGRYVYYTSNKHGGALELYRVNTSGQPKPEQVSILSKEVRSLSVSPENGYIVLGVMSATVPFGEDLKPFSADLYVLDQNLMNKILSSGKLVTLDDLELILSEPTEKHIWHEQPDWEPGVEDIQSRIAYVRTQNYDNDPIMVDEIWTVNLDGSNNTRLIKSSSMPRWTLDRAFITTHEFKMYDVKSKQTKQIHISNLARDAGAASISPDGKYVLFETDDRDRNAGVARLTFKQGDTKLPDNSYSLLLSRPAYEPRWSPVPLSDPG